MSFGCVCGGMIVGLMWVVVAAAGAASSSGHLRASDGNNKYQGYQFWHPNQTLSVKTLVETPFARTQMHTVKLENGDVSPVCLFSFEVCQFSRATLASQVTSRPFSYQSVWRLSR